MKILFSDFDGTLVDGNQPLSLKNKEKMQELQNAGHLVVICTGRNITEYQRDEHLFHFPFDYLVLNNGGHIVDKNYQTIYEKVIDKEVGVDILNHLITHKNIWSFFADGKRMYGYRDGITIDHGKDGQEIHEDFVASYQQADHFQIICFHQEDQGITDSQKCYDYIKEKYSEQVEPFFNLHYVDVAPSGCSKGKGVAKLLELIDEDIDEVYAIGDSYNDLPMIQEADYGYTFHYANEKIKKETKYHVNYVYEVIDDMLGGN